MPRRLLKIVARSLSRGQQPVASKYSFAAEDVVWVMGSFCAFNRKPFDAELLLRQFPPPYSADSLIHAALALGFRIKRRDCDSAALPNFNFPGIAVLNEDCSENDSSEAVRPEPVEGRGAAHADRQHERPSDEPAIQSDIHSEGT